MTYFLIFLCSALLVSTFLLRRRVTVLEDKLNDLLSKSDPGVESSSGPHSFAFPIQGVTRLAPNFMNVSPSSVWVSSSFSKAEHRQLHKSFVIGIGGVLGLGGVFYGVYHYFPAFTTFLTAVSMVQMLCFALTALTLALFYILLKTGFPARLVMYTTVSFVLSLIFGLGIIFSGPALVIAYAGLCLTMFVVADYVGLSERLVKLVVLSYLLPVGMAVGVLGQIIGGTAIAPLEVLSLVAVWLLLMASALWRVHHLGMVKYNALPALETVVGGTGYIFGYITIAVITKAQFGWPDAYVMMYLGWSLVSLCVLLYLVKYELPSRLTRVVASSLLIPVIASVTSLLWSGTPAGGYGMVGAWLLCVVLGVATLLLTQEYCRELDLGLRRVIGLLLITSIGLTLIVTNVTLAYWFETTLAMVTTYLVYAIIGYFIVALLLSVRGPAEWIVSASLFPLLPIGMSLTTLLGSTAWSSYQFTLYMTGLCAIVVFTAAIARGVLQHRHVITDVLLRRLVEAVGMFYCVVATVVSFILLWYAGKVLLVGPHLELLLLFIYMSVGFLVCGYGLHQRQTIAVYLGSGVLAFALLRFFMFELPQLGTALRIIALCVGSVLCVAGSVLLQRVRARRK